MLFKSRIEARLLKAREVWMESMFSYRGEPGLVCPPILPLLNERHLENCRLVDSRDHIMGYMPLGQSVAEIGVLAGDISTLILDKCASAELHLVALDLESRGIRRRFSREIASSQVMFL